MTREATPSTALPAAPTFQRQAFEVSRNSEYFDPGELEKQTGRTRDQFATVVLKELVDNALDAAEAFGVEPEVAIEVDSRDELLRIAVADNGAGLSEELVAKTLNFHTRTSDKLLYRTPTRGAQGNGLKTVLGMPVALGGKGPMVIEAAGRRHLIRAKVSPGGEARVDRVTEDVELAERDGTRIAVEMPRVNQVLTKRERDYDEQDEFDPLDWATAFSLFNPHATISIRWRRPLDAHALLAQSGDAQSDEFEDSCQSGTGTLTFRPSVSIGGADGWRKYMPGDHPSAHWFDRESLVRLVHGHINQAHTGGQNLLLRDFVRQFRGLTDSPASPA